MTEYIARYARISRCGRYRYELGRRWSKGPHVTWVMLTAGKADAVTDDLEVRKCVKYAQRWGYGAIRMLALFAFRAADAEALRRAHGDWLDNGGPDPVGDPENERTISCEMIVAQLVVFAWGAPGERFYPHRVQRVQALVAPHVEARDLQSPQCLGLTKGGSPKHPARLAYSVPLQPFPMNAIS